MLSTFNTGSQFSSVECDLTFLKKSIGKIDISKSSGVQDISSEVLKHTFETLPYHLLHLVNLIIRKNIFPDSWKQAIVSPLPKGGDKTDVNNRRPISILPLPAKIMEKVLHKQLLTYLLDENLLNENQDGFRPDRSTIDSIEKCI